MSLRTNDEAVAKRRLNAELQKWDALFEEIRSRREVTDQDKACAVWEHYEATLLHDAEKRRSMPTTSDMEEETNKIWRRIDLGEIHSGDVVGMINGYAYLELMKRARGDDANLRMRRLAALRRGLVSGEQKLIEDATRDFITHHNLLVDDGSAKYRELSSLMIRGEIQALERYTGHYSGVPSDPIVKPAVTAPRVVAAPGEGIMELFEVYAKENPRSITAYTLKQARRDIGIFVQHVGTTYPATKIDKKAVREWKALLMLYPVKATETKEFAGMKIAQIIEHNKKVGKPVLTSRTANRYLSSLDAFCNWPVAHGVTNINPTDGMSLAKDKQKKVFPFMVEQMNILFNSPLFIGCASD